MRRAIKDVFGEHALVHRCHRHKERNVTDLLPERDRPAVLAKVRGAWALTDAKMAEQRLERLAEQQFRRIIGYRDLAKLVIAIERDAAREGVHAPATVTHTQVPEVITV